MTTPAPPLSPAAQAVWDAYKTGGLDAALIAAADQVVPEEPPLTQRQISNVVCVKRYQQRQKNRSELLAIATELRQEGQG